MSAHAEKQQSNKENEEINFKLLMIIDFIQQYSSCVFFKRKIGIYKWVYDLKQ